VAGVWAASGAAVSGVAGAAGVPKLYGCPVTGPVGRLRIAIICCRIMSACGLALFCACIIEFRIASYC